MDPNISINPNHFKLNKPIEIKLKTKKKGFMSGGLFGSTNTQIFKVPPLNAAIESGFGKAPERESKGFKGFQAGPSVNNITNIPFLNWASIRSNSFDDPNNIEMNSLKYLNF